MLHLEKNAKICSYVDCIKASEASSDPASGHRSLGVTSSTLKNRLRMVYYLTVLLTLPKLLIPFLLRHPSDINR